MWVDVGGVVAELVGAGDALERGVERAADRDVGGDSGHLPGPYGLTALEACERVVLCCRGKEGPCYGCFNPHWTEGGTQAFACRTGYCGGASYAGDGWGVVGSDTVASGARNDGMLVQQPDRLPGPGTLKFRLKRGVEVSGVVSQFSAFEGHPASGNGSTVFFATAGAGPTSWEEISVPVFWGFDSQLGFISHCTNNTGTTQTCPEWRVDDVSLVIDEQPLDTFLDQRPPLETPSGEATFTFYANKSHVQFKCSLDGAKFKNCSSPKTYNVKVGKHTFKVRARDLDENDKSAATYRWRRTRL